MSDVFPDQAYTCSEGSRGYEGMSSILYLIGLPDYKKPTCTSLSEGKKKNSKGMIRDRNIL